MSSTLLRSMKAYKSKEPRWGEEIYELIVNTAESNIEPLHYEHWVITCNKKWLVMKTICEMAGNLYSGVLKWPGAQWRDEEICSKFLRYAENVIRNAPTRAESIPEITSHSVINWNPDDPTADIWRKFIPLGYLIEKKWDREYLVKKHPTMIDLYYNFQIREHYENCLRYAREKGNLDIDKFRRYLYESGYMLPDEIRQTFKTGTEKS